MLEKISCSFEHYISRIPDRSWRFFAISYAMVLFSLNFIRIFDNNFWLDESFSINLAKMDFTGMIRATAADVHPPLYYAILMAMYRLFGDHGWVFHLTSIVPYATTMVFVLFVIWKKFDKGPVFLMITFISIMKSAVVYNVEVRMYSLAALFVLSAYYACYRIMTDDRWSGYFWFAVFALLAAYTHYYTIIPLSILVFFLFIFLFIKKRKFLKFVAVLSVSVFLYLPWINTVIRQFQRASGSFSRENPGLAKGLCYFFWQGSVLYSGLMLTFAAGLMSWLIWRGIKSTRENSENTDIHWIFFGYAASIGTLLVLEFISVLITPTFTYKYLHPVVGLMWLAFSISVSKLKRGNLVTGILTIATLLLSMPMYVETYKSDVEADRRCRSTREMMVEMVHKDDVMLTNIKHLDWEILQYYLPETTHKYVSEITEIESDKRYWILWSTPLTKIEGQNLQVIEKCNNCELGSTSFHLYQIEFLNLRN